MIGVWCCGLENSRLIPTIVGAASVAGTPGARHPVAARRPGMSAQDRMKVGQNEEKPLIDSEI